LFRLPSSAVVLLDTTYFGRGCGVMLLKDAGTKNNLLAAHVEQETIAAYQSSIKELQERHCRVRAIVCDGRRGLFKAFGDIPVQMCQFHQITIVSRYLTRHPKLPAARQLRRLTASLPRIKEACFALALDRWHTRWRSFLDERTAAPKTKRSRYAHPRLRSAFLSLKRNLPWLFTCLRHPTLQIPNTTNALDGHFADLKTKLRNHNGLSSQYRQNLILHFLQPAIISHFAYYAETSEKRQASQSIEQKVTKKTKKTEIRKARSPEKPLFPFVFFCSKKSISEEPKMIRYNQRSPNAPRDAWQTCGDKPPHISDCSKNDSIWPISPEARRLVVFIGGKGQRWRA
jgi:hypothetical protein